MSDYYFHLCFSCLCLLLNIDLVLKRNKDTLLHVICHLEWVLVIVLLPNLLPWRSEWQCWLSWGLWSLCLHMILRYSTVQYSTVIADRLSTRHIIAKCLSECHIIVQCEGWISASVNIYIYILSVFRNAIHTTIIIGGHNETLSHDSKTCTTFRHSPCCFPAHNGAWFWYLWLSYKFSCLMQVTIEVRGNVVLLARPSNNCKRGEGLVCIGGSVARNHQVKGEEG